MEVSPACCQGRMSDSGSCGLEASELKLQRLPCEMQQRHETGLVERSDEPCDL